MLRILLWAMILYFAWRLYVILTRKRPTSPDQFVSRHPDSTAGPADGAFDHIEDADFRDVTDQPPKQNDQ